MMSVSFLGIFLIFLSIFRNFGFTIAPLLRFFKRKLFRNTHQYLKITSFLRKFLNMEISITGEQTKKN